MVRNQPGWQRLLTQSWLRRGLLPRLLWPLSLVYGALVALRIRLYRWGLLAQHKLPVPLVVVGNVVAGGGGKTPLTIALVQHWRAQGRRPGIVSRGYGRTGSAATLVQHDSSPKQVGDEPLLMYRSTGVPVAVGTQRHQAARLLLQHHPQIDVIVCDDGLQHLALARDIEICVFDERGVSNGWLLPAGPLREPWPRPVSWVVQGEAAHTKAWRPVPGSWRLQRSLTSQARNGLGQTVTLADLVDPGRPIVALAGTAQPERFFDMLRDQGLPLSATQALPDHYDFDSYKATTDKVCTLVCTDKDAVKLWRTHPQAWAVGLQVQPDSRWLAALDQQLDQIRQAKLSSPHGHPTA